VDYKQEIIRHIELHDVEGIRNCFSNGVNPNETFKGEPLIDELTSEYLRGPRFKECVKVFVEFGLDFKDKALLAVLLDDPEMLRNSLMENPDVLSRRYTLRSAYTPLFDATLLHICAEFNHGSCAALLVKQGVDVNAKAGTDKYGFGGQTPIFHTVNQNLNQSAEMMDFLLENSADLNVTVKGIIWGASYPWETLIPAVNPISYAVMGLLPQMHRDERIISDVVARLIKHAYGIDYTPVNVPNKYLKQ
jgi:hypothetical protein